MIGLYKFTVAKQLPTFKLIFEVDQIATNKRQVMVHHHLSDHPRPSRHKSSPLRESTIDFSFIFSINIWPKNSRLIATLGVTAY